MQFPHRLRCKKTLHASSSEIGEDKESRLSSAYDSNLPAALVGEAVRSALRSDRGICFDFTSDRYATGQSDSQLLSVVQVKGEGTEPFINAKFSRSVPNHKVFHQTESAALALVRKGHAFETAYLSAKGRIIDRLLVLSFSGDEGNDDALLVTSPGNNGSTLYNQLSPLVFPMDKVTLNDFATTAKGDTSMKTNVITLACSSLKNAQHSFRTNVLDVLQMEPREFEFPPFGECYHYRVAGAGEIYITEHTFLSQDVCRGYTVVFQEPTSSSNYLLSEQVWHRLTAEENDLGPVGVGSLEYNTLRVEGGWAGFGNEITGDGPKKMGKSESAMKERLAKRRAKRDTAANTTEFNSLLEKDEGTADGAEEVYFSKANPLELHLQHLVDTEKGCYQGQEGVASLLNNKRGFPRQLYQVVFYDSENDFDVDFDSFSLINTINDEALRSFQQMKKEADPLINETRQPRAGDKLYALGSNEKIRVGTITSVAQRNGTGDRVTVALALIRRPGPILKRIKDMGLDLPRWWEDDNPDGEDSNPRNIAKEADESGIMMPPPLDALVNLEVVLEGSYTVGRLKSIPSRRMKTSKDTDIASLLNYEETGAVLEANNDGPALFKYQFTDAEIESKGKMKNDEMSTSSPVGFDDEIEEDDEEEEEEEDDDGGHIITDEQIAQAEKEAAEAAAAEAKRKAEKMALLKQRADAAMARRKKKKQQQ